MMDTPRRQKQEKIVEVKKGIPKTKSLTEKNLQG
jgi:hypothetical protein